MIEAKELPRGWKIEKLEHLLDRMSNGSSATQYEEKVGFAISRIETIWNETIDLTRVRYIKEKDKEFVSKYSLKNGDILFSHINSDIHLGKTSVFKLENKLTLIHGINLLLLRPSTKVTSEFLNYQLRYLRFQGKFIEIAHKSVNQSSINQARLKNIDVILPPLPEQHRIVAKLEELLSELEKGKEQLHSALDQLKVYRQAVLKYAFEGKLANKNVKDGELPKGWKWVKLIDVAKKITDGEHFRPKTEGKGIPFLSAKDVRDNGVSFEQPLYNSKETATKALQRCNPARGDILIVSRGATVGRMCIIKTDKIFCLLGSVILIKVNENLVSEYLTYILKSPSINQKLIGLSGATAQQAIYLSDIKNVEIPLPTIVEQHRIVEEIEDRLSVADKLEETITASLQQSETLRQSILKKAFEGKLV